MSTEDQPGKSPGASAGARSGADTSLRNFVLGLLVVSAIVVVAAFVLERAAG